MSELIQVMTPTPQAQHRHSVRFSERRAIERIKLTCQIYCYILLKVLPVSEIMQILKIGGFCKLVANSNLMCTE